MKICSVFLFFNLRFVFVRVRRVLLVVIIYVGRNLISDDGQH